jgi:hypothetical protein
MSKTNESSIDIANINYLCGECAYALGWRWPTGHCATMHSGVCDVCGDLKTLSCENDWLKGNEQTLRKWD